MTKIFLTHSPVMRTQYYGEKALAALREIAEVKLSSGPDEPSVEEMIEAAQDCDVIIGARIPIVPALVFDSLPRLAAFCRVAVDVRNIDIDAASRNGVLVTRATPGFGPSVSEWIIGTMINLSRNIVDYCLAYRQNRDMEVGMGRELRGATLGIIGYGTIGRYLASLGLAFGMKVQAYDPFQSIETEGVGQCGFDELLSQSDFVVCLAVSTPETHHLIDARALSLMQSHAFFINASRGELIDEAALLEALDSRKIAGAGMDVGMALDQKPSPALAVHPRVVASPHIGGLTPEAVEHQAWDTVEQVRAMLEGRIPPNALNAGHAHRFASRFLAG
ncbi:hydroxyacid dehydrogenase [Paracandidimonas soli]|uniref:hydroxyacid dehydrogenase n=1 Tax=Paracandidimonas soli TaxID=1917182 RepID=UPI00334212A2